MANLSTYQIKLNHFKQLNLVDLFSLENNFSIKMFSSLGTPRSWVLFKDKEPIVYLDFNYHQLLSPSEAQKSYNLNMSSSQPLLWLDSIYTSPDFRKNHYGFYLLFRLREYYQFPAMGLKLHPLEPAISYIKLKKAYQSNDKLKKSFEKYHFDHTDSTFYAFANTITHPSFKEWNIEHYLPQITAPIFAIQGFDDEYGTELQVDAIVNKSPNKANSKLMIKNCGHSPHLQMQPLVVSKIVEFYTKITSSTIKTEKQHEQPTL